MGMLSVRSMTSINLLAKSFQLVVYFLMLQYFKGGGVSAIYFGEVELKIQFEQRTIVKQKTSGKNIVEGWGYGFSCYRSYPIQRYTASFTSHRKHHFKFEKILSKTDFIISNH